MKLLSNETSLDFGSSLNSMGDRPLAPQDRHTIEP